MIDSGYFFNPIRRDIDMAQGDTCSFGFQLQGLGGKRPEGIYLSCKETVEDDEALFRVSNNDNIDLRSYDEDKDILTYGVRIPPSYTHNLPLGRYFYDLQVQVNGDIITLMKGRLTLEYQITREYTPEPPPIIYEDGDGDKYPQADIPASLKKIYTTLIISNIAAKMRTIDNPLPTATYTTEEMVEELDSIQGKIEDIKTEAITIADWGYIPTLSETRYLINSFGSSFDDIKTAIYNLSGVYEDNYTQLADAISSLIWEGTQEEYDALTTINPNTLYIIVEDEEEE